MGWCRCPVLGVTAGKDVGGIVDELVPLAAGVILTRAQHPRSLDPVELVGSLPNVPTWIEPDVTAALSRSRLLAAATDLVCVTGSVFLVGEAIWTVESARESR